MIINPYSFFNPLYLSPALWLDGSDPNTLYDATTGGSLVAADGTISRWEDKSGNARHATQATAAARPLRKTAVTNGLDVARFDNTDDGMITAFFLYREFDMFIVSSQSSAATSRVVASNTINALVSPNRASFAAYVTANIRNDPWGVADEVVLTTLSAPSAGNFLLRKSGADITTSALTASNWGTVAIGASGIGGNPVNGDIMEIVIYPSLSATDRAKVETYLNNKWSIY